MSATFALLWVLVLRLAIGVGAGLVMGRRGHDPFGWLPASPASPQPPGRDR